MRTTHELRLTGLIGSNPLGAMAAFGLLRVCSQIPEIINPRLSWCLEDDWIAVLTVQNENGVDDDKFINLLLSYLLDSDMEDAWGWNQDIRIPPDDFREHLKHHAGKASADERMVIDFFSAFGSEIIPDSGGKKIKPTAFYMVRGGFLDSINTKITQSLKQPKRTENNSKASFQEALFGPWEYQDIYHSLGWDPSTERMHALQHYNPGKAGTKEAKASCVRAAVWLAANALPLFPVLPNSRGQLLTTGFKKIARNTDAFMWPIWQSPISIAVLSSLLVSPEWGKPIKNDSILSHRGIKAVFQSVRSPYGKGSAVFRPATVEWIAG